MKFCVKCGLPAKDDNQKFCMRCGAPFPTQNNMGAQGSADQNEYRTSPNYNTQSHSMKWFKALIYFGLILGAIIYFAAGIEYLTGYVYEIQSGGRVEADYVYTIFGNALRVIDITYGIVMLGMTGFTVYVRQRLAGYHKNGPMCLYALYITSAVITLIYCIAVMCLQGSEAIDQSSIISEMVSAIAIGVTAVWTNYIYFSKRKDMFTDNLYK